MKKTLFAALLLGASLVNATDLKFGYVNVDRIFAEAKPAIAVQEAMKKEFSGRQVELQKSSAQLQTEQQQMQAIAAKAKNNDISTLNKADKKALEDLQKQFSQDQMKFQQAYSAFQQDVQKAQEISSSILLGKTNSLLKNLSEKGGFDLVVTSQQLVYAKAKYDITDSLMQELNKLDSAEVLKQIADAEKVNPNAATLKPEATK